jgi:hypothetical protein
MLGHRRFPPLVPLLGLAVLGASLHASESFAQIKQPGAHPRYAVELDPHLTIQIARNWRSDDEGFGPGFRATIPFLQNGPIPKINNSMGIGFGLDWTRFGECDGNRPGCSEDQLWFPVVVQWNFFLTPSISVFGEPGLALQHRAFRDEDCDEFSSLECDDSDWEYHEPVFFAGGRFLITNSVGIVVRLGTPYISIGASILM